MTSKMGSITKPEALPVIKAEIKKFEALQSKYSEYGTYDSEPDREFQRTLIRAVKGEEGEIWPNNAGDWELYTCSMNCNKAGKALSDQTEKIVGIIRELKVLELAPVTTWVRGYCWRIDF